MACPDCEAATLAFPVPEELRSLLPGDEPGGVLCRRCLALHPEPDPPADVPDFQQVSDALPSDRGAAVRMALIVGLLSNLALYRSEIGELLEDVERAGSDPLLVLDRLAHDEGLEPTVDLSGRRRQLEQLL